MSEPLDNLVTLYDEDGQEATFRELLRLTLRGKTYCVLEELEDPDSVLIFNVTEEEDGTETLCFVEDEDEAEDVFCYYQAEAEDYEYGPAE